MTDHEYGQAVMAAASVPITQCECGHDVQDHLKANETSKRHGRFCMEYPCDCESYTRARAVYPDPLTPQGFDALWDGLVANGYFVRVASPRVGGIHCVRVYSEKQDLPVVDNIDRKAALLEAAGLALGVKRS
jgi:hypothetical protein